MIEHTICIVIGIIIGGFIGAGLMRLWLGQRVLNPNQRDELLFEDAL